MRKLLTKVLVLSVLLIGGTAEAQQVPGMLQASPNVTLSNGQTYNGSFDLSPYLTGSTGIQYTPFFFELAVSGYEQPTPVNYTINISYNKLDVGSTGAAYSNYINNTLNADLANLFDPLKSEVSSIPSLQSQAAGLQSVLSGCQSSACVTQGINQFEENNSTISSDFAGVVNDLLAAGAKFANDVSKLQNPASFAVYSPTSISLPFAAGTDPEGSLSVEAGGYSTNNAFAGFDIPSAVLPSINQYAQNYAGLVTLPLPFFSSSIPSIQPGTSPVITVPGYSGSFDTPFYTYSGNIIAGGELSVNSFDQATGMLDYTVTANTNSSIDISGVQLLYELSPNVAAVPEPETWLLMILGFGVIGYARRRSSKVSATALAVA